MGEGWPLLSEAFLEKGLKARASPKVKLSKNLRSPTTKMRCRKNCMTGSAPVPEIKVDLPGQVVLRDYSRLIEEIPWKATFEISIWLALKGSATMRDMPYQCSLCGADFVTN